MERFNYFVYGSSMDFEAFEGWAKQHSQPMPDLSNYEIATLPNYELVFNIQSKFWGGGVVSLKPSAGQQVEGISINLPIDLQNVIRQKEGVPNGLYDEHTVTISTSTGNKDAVVYIGAPSKVNDSVIISERFANALLKGAQARGLSSQWIDKLKSYLPNHNDEHNNLPSTHPSVDDNNNNSGGGGGSNKPPSSQESEIKPKVNEDSLLHILSTSFPSHQVLKVKDESSGCGSKFSVLIVSDSFEGVSLVNRHKQVNHAVKDILPLIHALTLKTWTPTQYSSKIASGEIIP